MLCRYGSFGLPQPPTSYIGPLSNCTDFTGPLPELAQNLVYNFNNSGQTFRSMCCIRMSVCLLYGRTCLQQMTGSCELLMEPDFTLFVCSLHIMNDTQQTAYSIQCVVQTRQQPNIAHIVPEHGLGCCRYDSGALHSCQHSTMGGTVLPSKLLHT